MSLIRARRERRDFGVARPRKAAPLSRILLMLVVVLGLIWWLTGLSG